MSALWISDLMKREEPSCIMTVSFLFDRGFFYFQVLTLNCSRQFFFRCKKKIKKSCTMPQQIIQIVLNACWWHQCELNVWVESAASGSELLQHFLSITTLSPSAIFLFSLSLGHLKNMLKLLLAYFPLPVYSPKSAEMGLFNVFFSFTLYLVTPNPWAWEEQRRYLFTYFIVVLSKDTSWKVVCTFILFSFFSFIFLWWSVQLIIWVMWIFFSG